MARNAEHGIRRRVIGARVIKQAAIAAATSLALLTTVLASAQSAKSWADLQNEVRNIESNLNTLADWSEQANSPWQKQLVEAGFDEQLNKLLGLEWEAYRRCMAIQNPTSGNSGDIYKLEQTLQHRNEAMQGLGGIVKIFGGVSGKTLVSAATGEGTDNFKDAVLQMENNDAVGKRLSGVYAKAATALSVVDAGTKLYQLAKAVSVGLDAIDARSAADAAMAECKKPPDPELPDTGTPELKPHGPKPHQPDRPSPPNPDPPPPPQHVPLGKVLMNWASKQGQGG